MDDGDARQRLAAYLRGLREAADDGRGVTFRALAERTHFSAPTLNRATTGREVPTWPVVEAFVAACGEDPEDTRALWEQAQRDATASPSAATDPEPAAAPPSPASGTGSGPGWRVPRWAAVLAAAVVLAAVVVAAVAITGRSDPAPTPVAAPVTSAAGASGSPVVSSSAPPAPVVPVGPTGAEIDSPAGATVGFKFTVAGALTGSAPTGALWEVTLEMDDDRYYPLNRACAVLGGGQFTCGDTYAGQETMAPGYQFTVLVVDADPDAVTAFHQYHALKDTPAGDAVHGLTALPAGAQIVGQKLVTRT